MIAHVVLAALLLLTAAAAPAAAQVDGHASVMLDVLPDVDEAPGSQHAIELRARLFAEHRRGVGEHLRLYVSGHVDGLLARRPLTGGGVTRTADALARPLDTYLDVVTSVADVRVGMSRIVWGRLDEFQPTDVINPIDLTRFLLEGRAEARLPVLLARARFFLPRGSSVEAIVVPAFRASRFDQLDEASSPFSLVRDAVGPLTLERDEPAVSAAALQGGVRFTSTVRRIDWSVSAYRGFRTFPTLTLDAAAFRIRETFPRFTMIGADVETVRGPWGLRAEAAAFVDDELQSSRLARGVAGRSVEAGAGVDRRAGDYRVAANLLWSWRAVDGSDPAARLLQGDEEVERSDVTIVVAADRSFARETRTVRVLGTYDPAEAAAFARVIAAASVRDNTWVEGSAGVFAGSALDTIGRLTRRDFLYVKLKVFF